jgi:hypothetical protein
MAGEDQKQEMEDELWDQCIKLRQRAEAAEREVERLNGATAKLREAYRHYQAVKRQGKSEFIKENGRFGGSPWAELCDAIETLLAAKGDGDGK